MVLIQFFKEDEEKRKLVLLIQSKEMHFQELLPQGHELSYIDLRTVQLHTSTVNK